MRHLNLFQNLYHQDVLAILKLLEMKKGARLLDVGCGAGEITMRMGESISTDEMSGIEFDAKRARKAKQKGINVCLGDLNSSFPFKSDFFDVIISRQVIEHLVNVDNFAKEIYRVLKPGGYAVVSTPNLSSWPNVLSLILGYQPFSSQLSSEFEIGNPLSPQYATKISPPHDPYTSHKKMFSYQGFRQFFTVHGFFVDKIIGVGYVPFPSSFASILALLDGRHAQLIVLKGRKPVKKKIM